MDLYHIFRDDFEFQIPVYQRPYAWDLEQVGELFDDLVSALNHSETEPYFLGSIVLIKHTSNPRSDVIDGQQRLTTLTMLLCVLRELTDADWPGSLDNRIRQQADVAARKKEVVRLRLRMQDQDFFHKHVQSIDGVSAMIRTAPSTSTDSQVRIVENVTYLFSKVEQLTIDERKRLAAFLITQCYLVVVTTDSKSSAYRVFAVMNDRGLDLTPTDILKAEVVGAISSETERTNYAHKWEIVEEELGRDRFSELFSHIRTIYAKDKLRSNLQDAFHDQVLSQETPTDFIDQVLMPYSEAFKKTVGLDFNVHDRIKPYLRHLQRLSFIDWIPPVLTLFFDPPEEKERFIEFVIGIEALAYGLFILRANVNTRIARFAEVTKAIQRQETNEIRISLSLSEEEKSQILRTLDGPIYEMTRVRMPLLLRLDSLLAGAEATYDHPIVTIEHVLPQTPDPNSQWVHWFPDEEIRADWTHRLANLVLLSWRKNVQASNYEFDRKKSVYFMREGVSPFALTMPVLTQSEWTPDVLESRQQILLGRLKNAWQLDISQS